MSIKRLSKITIEFFEKIRTDLPPVIARKEVPKFLGGMIAAQTLSNADKAGEGPEGAYRVGKVVVYQTDQLLNWIERRYGVTPIAELRSHYRERLHKV